jgi:hypothetical protein
MCSAFRVYLVGSQSFSDNDEKLKISDVSSTSDFSDTDSKLFMNNERIVRHNVSKQPNNRKWRRSQREMTLLCSRQIHYFLQKYADLTASEIFIIIYRNDIGNY